MAWVCLCDFDCENKQYEGKSLNIPSKPHPLCATPAQQKIGSLLIFKKLGDLIAAFLF